MLHFLVKLCHKIIGDFTFLKRKLKNLLFSFWAFTLSPCPVVHQPYQPPG